MGDGQWIRERRTELGLTQAALASKVGVVQGTISQWENGNLTPDAKMRKALQAQLGPPVRPASKRGQTFGEWLKAEREKRGWTRTELAEHSNVSPVQIYNLEAGRSLNPQKNTRQKITRALGRTLPRDVVEQEEADAAIEEAATFGTSGVQSFDPWDDADWPDTSGVYWFLDEFMRLTYVGKGDPIRARLKDHEDHKWYVDRVVASGRYVEIKDGKMRRFVEDILIKAGGPLINKNQHDDDRR